MRTLSSVRLVLLRKEPQSEEAPRKPGCSMRGGLLKLEGRTAHTMLCVAVWRCIWLNRVSS